MIIFFYFDTVYIDVYWCTILLYVNKLFYNLCKIKRYIQPSIYLSNHLSIYLSNHLSSIYLSSIYLSSIYFIYLLSIYLLSIYLLSISSIYLLSIYLQIEDLSIHPSIHPDFARTTEGKYLPHRWTTALSVKQNISTPQRTGQQYAG